MADNTNSRRRFLLGTAGIAAAATTLAGRRRLGALEVSSVGLGCQTMPGTLYGPVSSRQDVITVIRTAVEQGVTLFDTAEVYGPLESERIVGEALQSVRDRVVIASKFGFDVNQQTGERGGLNSRPDHIRQAVDGMLRRITSICSTSTGWTRRCPSRMWPAP